MTVIDSVDVSDICDDVDEVAIMDGCGPGAHRALAFVDDDGVMVETDVDLTDYPAVVAVARRGLEADRPVRFDPLPTVDVTEDMGLDDDV